MAPSKPGIPVCGNGSDARSDAGGQGRRRAIGGQTCQEQRLKARAQRVALGRRQAGAASVLGGGDGRFHLPQQVFQVTGPRLLQFFFDERQLAEVMDIAGRMAPPQPNGEGSVRDQFVAGQ